MGRLYLEHIGGKRLFSCKQCDTFLTNRGELISTRFTGATGRAFLFNKVVNLIYRYVEGNSTFGIRMASPLAPTTIPATSKCVRC